MDFWATWCGPCRLAMPGLQKLHEDFSGRSVKVVGVNCQETDSDPGAFMSRNNYTYPIALEGDAVAEAYHVSGLPTFYVVDQEGRVAYSAVGFGEEIEAKITEVVKGLLTGEEVAAAESGT